MVKRRYLLLFFILTILLVGCEIRTVDEMYVPPERSEDHNSLQSLINSAMTDLEYCAPSSGENQQLVQMADLDGDGEQECLLYAKGGEQRPLHILVFAQQNNTYVHAHTIDLVGSSFDKVVYAQFDGKPGLEVIVGSQVSDQVSRSVSVYSFYDGDAEHLVTADYLNFQIADLNSNGLADLFVLRSGPTDNDRGIVELFSFHSDGIERSIELNLSETADKRKRILVGQLYGGEPAVYVASAVDEDTLITDVYTVVNGVFTNVSLSSEVGTSIKTMRNYFVYADDMDSDNAMELPRIVPTRPIDMAWQESGDDLIAWYSITAAGEEIIKLYTYHNFIGGWYIQFDKQTAENISVVNIGNNFDFYFWDGDVAVKMFSIVAFTGQNRDAQSNADGYFPLHRTESTVYSAKLDDSAEEFSFTKDFVMRSFHVIHEHWNTGET